MRNARRAELLAEALGINDATKNHGKEQLQDSHTCIRGDPEAMCNPDPSTGGGYCSREWAGVCQPCYIPNALQPFPDNATLPACPWDIFTRKDSDYADPSLHVKCASDLPRDYCCLYLGTCNAELIANARNFTGKVTEDGFAYSASLQSTRVMMSFLWRGIKDRFDFSIFGTGGFDELSYWQWDRQPLPGVTLAKAMARVEAYRKAEKS